MQPVASILSAARRERRQASRQHESLWLSMIRYRWVIIALVSRDLKARYRGSALGFLWTFLNPLLFMGVYTLVFSFYFRIDTKNYPVFVLSGLLPWLWFGGAVQQGATSIIDGNVYVGRTIFPTQVLPVVPVVSHMMNFIFSLPLLLLFLVLFHVQVGWNLLALPLVMLSQFVLCLGIALFTATYNVFFRDLQQLIGHLLTLLFFVMPNTYPLSTVPESVRPWVASFPLTWLPQSYQNIFFYNKPPDWLHLFYLMLISLALCWFGKRVFDRHKESFAEYV